MKRYIITAATLIVAYAANAQINSIPIIGNRFTVGIDGGLSIPSSDFASNSPSSSSIMNGHAKSGYYYDIYAGVRLISILGIMAQYAGNSNSMNTSDFSSSASASGGYITSEYLAGPYISIKLLKIKIEAKLLAGMVTNSPPSISESGSNIVTAYKTGSGFGYCAGAKIKYMMIGGMLGIGLGLNYVGSDVKYSGATVNGASVSVSSKMSIGLIQPTLGLSLDI